MATLSTTTLGAAVTAGGTLWPLASTTGVTTGTVLFADEEAAIVTGPVVGLSAPVQRGMLGSTVAAHGSGITVYLGTPSQFYQQDPMGTPPATLETDPWINTVNGTIWTSSGGQWVIAGGGGGSFANPTITGTVAGGATYTAPTFTTPTLGVATATSVNKVALTAPAASATLTIANTKTLTVSNSLTLAGTDATVMTFPTTSASVARTDAANTFTGVQTMTSPALTTPVLTGSITGTYTLAGTPTITGPAISSPVLSGSATGTYTLAGTPTITAPAISAPVLSGTATGTYTLGGTPTITAPALSGTVTGTYTLGGTPTLASAAGVPYAAGVAAGYKVARGLNTQVAASDTVVTGLATVVACVVSHQSAPTLKQLFVAGDIGNQAGAPAAGSILIKSYKPTAANDVTPTAATDFTDNIVYAWIAIGT